jgi:hypothetical protein
MVFLLRGQRWEVVIASGPFLLKSLGVSWLLTFAAMASDCRQVSCSRSAHQWTTAVEADCRERDRGGAATPQLMVIFWVFFAVTLTGIRYRLDRGNCQPIADRRILPRRSRARAGSFLSLAFRPRASPRG